MSKRNHNRDVVRQNKATTVVKGCMYNHLSDIGNNTIKKATDKIINSNTATQSLSSTIVNELRHISTIASLNIDANKKSRDLFMKCSTYIKTGANRIAKNEIRFIEEAYADNECHLLPNLMTHYNKDFETLHRQMRKVPSTPTSSQTTGVFPVSTTRTVTQPESSQTDYPTLILPVFRLPVPEHNNQYQPLEAMHILCTHGHGMRCYVADLPKNERNEFLVKDVSVNFLITLMINKKLVPRSRGRVYKLFAQYKATNTLTYSDWVTTKIRGPKRHLSNRSLNKLRDKYATQTIGGAAMGKSELKKELEILIKEDRELYTKHTYPHKEIPSSTMKRYIGAVTAEEDLNIHTCVSNKSESRSIAEYSIRSTITYLMVVLTTHLFRAEPHPFSMPMKTLENDPLYSLIKELNDKVLGADKLTSKDDKPLPLTHALSNLLTTTDECSMFITAEEVKKRKYSISQSDLTYQIFLPSIPVVAITLPLIELGIYICVVFVLF